MQRIKEKGRTRTEIVGNVARRVKDFAKEIDKPVFLLIQVSREGKDGKQRLKLSSARDSGEIEEGCDFLTGQYMDNDLPDTIHFQMLKNRQGDIFINDTVGQPDEVLLSVDRKSLRINPIWENYYDRKGSDDTPF